MSIELVRLTSEYKEQLFEMLTEWKNDIIVNHTDRSLWKIWANDFHDFDNYLKNLDTKKETKDGLVRKFGKSGIGGIALWQIHIRL